jgi:predicted Zn finger-like uncharacterized protein
MIEVQCTSCHTKYRIDEQVLPAGTPTFKCSRCGHVFSFEPRASKPVQATAKAEKAVSPETVAAPRGAARSQPMAAGAAPPHAETPSKVTVNQAAESGDASRRAKPVAAPTPEPASDAPAASRAGGPSNAAVAARGIDEGSHSSAIAEPSPGGTAEFLSRPFGERREDLADGENMSFDFHDDNPLSAEAEMEEQAEPDRESTRWEVGEDPGFDVGANKRMRDAIHSFPSKSATGTVEKRRRRGAKLADDDAFVDELAAPVYNRGITRSARFFLMMFLLVAIGFGATALMIHEAPAAAADVLNRLPVIGGHFVPPTTPARLVALREVHADYQRTRNGATALVITGTAENVGSAPLHVVQIAVNLRDQAQRAIAAGAVYCGNNNLAPRMISAMTPHEIEFFQKLNPPRNFTLDPSASAPFVLIFMNPPATASRFDVAVARAVAAPDESEAPPAS